MDDFDIEYDLTCPKCNNSPIHSRDCNNWCNDGYLDEYDDDPINSPEEGIDLYPCPECKGTGIERWCPKCGANLSGYHFPEWDEDDDPNYH